MGLFGNKDEKRAKAAAAALEASRLSSLSLQDLAAEVLPAFGPDGMAIKSGHQRGAMQVVSWHLPDAPARVRQPVLGPVVEALGLLDNAGMVTRSGFGTQGSASTYRLSSKGETALSEGSAGRLLAT